MVVRFFIYLDHFAPLSLLLGSLDQLEKRNLTGDKKKNETNNGIFSLSIYIIITFI